VIRLLERALSTWTYASWTMIAHHTCHGRYNRIIMNVVIPVEGDEDDMSIVIIYVNDADEARRRLLQNDPTQTDVSIYFITISKPVNLAKHCKITRLSKNLPLTIVQHS
jgi:hypothetical protein